jgi:hypothetical protein
MNELYRDVSRFFCFHFVLEIRLFIVMQGFWHDCLNTPFLAA